MRTCSKLIYTLLFALLAVVGCNHSMTEKGNYGIQTSSVEDSLSDEITVQKTAICVYPQAGLRNEPGQKKYTSDKEPNYITTIYYGEEVALLGESQTLPKESRTYLKVRLKDGKEGWVHEYLFEKNARLAALLEDTEIYRRPDMMTLRDDKFQAGEIVVTMEHQGEWLHVTGRSKARKGWIRTGKEVDKLLSWEENDVKVALKYYLALKESDTQARKEKLQAIISDQVLGKSELIPLVKQRLDLEARQPVDQPLNALDFEEPATVYLYDTDR